MFPKGLKDGRQYMFPKGLKDGRQYMFPKGLKNSLSIFSNLLY